MAISKIVRAGLIKPELNYSVGGVIWFWCPVCKDTAVTLFHSRYKDQIPFCPECKTEFKMGIVKIERENHVR